MIRYLYNTIVGNSTSGNLRSNSENSPNSSKAYRYRARAPAPKHKGPTPLLTAETVANVVEDILARVEDLQEQQQNSDQIAPAPVTPEQQIITPTMTEDISPLALPPATNSTAPTVAYSLTEQNIDYSSSEVIDSEASDDEQDVQIAPVKTTTTTTTTTTTNASPHEALFEANSSSSDSDSDSDSSEEEEEVTPRRSGRARVPTNRTGDFVDHRLAEVLGAFDSQVMESEDEDEDEDQRRVHFHPNVVTGVVGEVISLLSSSDEDSEDEEIANEQDFEEQDFGNDGTFDPIEFTSEDLGTAIIPSNGAGSSSSSSSSNSSHARDIARGARDRFLPTITTLKANLTLANEHNAALQAERDTAQAQRDTAQSRVQELEQENATLKKDNAKKTRQLTLGKRIANHHGFGGSRKRQRR